MKKRRVPVSISAFIRFKHKGTEHSEFHRDCSVLLPVYMPSWFKKIILSIFFLLAIQSSFSQGPAEILNKWGASTPIEKAYLHTDRENYFAGETIWLKGYLLADYSPDTISTSLYVELLNDSSRLLSRKIFPVYNGISFGQVELSDSLYSGHYLLRAYTSTMLNAGNINETDPFIFQQKIYVAGKNINRVIEKPGQHLKIDFYPESGNYVSSIENTMAFKATLNYGIPAAISGIIKNEKGDTITSFRSYHDGMGMFEIRPDPGVKYFAMVDGDSTAQRYYLPVATASGMVLKVMPAPRGKFIEVIRQNCSPEQDPAFVIGQMQHRVVFNQKLQAGNNDFIMTLYDTLLPSGILQVTVFNKDNMPLAERLSFVDHGEYRIRGNIIADTTGFQRKSKNVFHVSLPAGTTGSFSVSVTDDDLNNPGPREQNIISSFFLSSDIRGPIPNAAWYFSSGEDTVLNSLDLLMMVNGWRRFSWIKLLAGYPPVLYHDLSFISLKGRAGIRDTRKPFASKDMILFVTTPDSSHFMKMAWADEKGNFLVDSLLFFGRSRIFFKDIRGKKSDLLDIKLYGDSITRKIILPAPLTERFHDYFPQNINLVRMDAEYNSFVNGKGILLKGVTVRTRKRSPVDELENRYIKNGLFSGFDEHTIDLVNNSNDVIGYNNIFDYLQYHVPGLNIQRNGLDYTIYYRQFASISGMGRIPMTLYLDEVETDASFISTIPATEIALVKVYSHFVGAAGGGPGGALAIYTKKGSDLFNSAGSDDVVRYEGYSIIKDFYSPDYGTDTAAIKRPDNRITLFWQPDIIFNGSNTEFPFRFYNNDRTKEFRIVVEGMTDDGRLLMIEKLIGPKGF